MSSSRGSHRVHYDVVLGSVPEQAVGSLIVHHLATKGFCVLDPSFEEGTFQRVAEDLEELDFYQAHPMIADGLLGLEGSAKIADMESNVDEEARSEGESLISLDRTLTKLGYIIEPFLGAIDFDMTHRSPAVVHHAGEAEDPATIPALTEAEASKWQSQFLRHRVMICIFVGPQTGSLELRPFDIEDAEPHTIDTSPGMVVLLRTYSMSHSHTAAGTGGAYAVSCFLLTQTIRKDARLSGALLTPAAKRLEAWMLDRVRILKERETSGVVNAEVPQGWQAAVNHSYHKGQMAGIAGTACMYNSSRNVSSWFAASSMAADYVTEVPISRWNHEEVYDPDPESWERGKACCRHGSFMEGTELFDAKFFSLSVNDARGLDPHQRILMEVAYESLYMMGRSKKNMMNAAGGVYVGCGNDEWAFHPGRQGFGLVTGVASMWSGRLSFALGLKGPAISLTTEAASGLSATYVAAESVQSKGQAVSNAFAVSVAPHVLLAAMWWPQHCMQGWLSRSGRCATFNSSADGFVRGDGCGALALKGATEMAQGELIANEHDTFVGHIAGAFMSTNGKTASFSTPHGPGEQECVSQAIRNAQLAPADIDGVECFGNGNFLSDAVEAGSMWRGHRSEVMKDPLTLGACKSSVGNQVECSGITGMLRTLYAAKVGHLSPNLHLRQCNPHIDPFEQPFDLVNENIDFPYKSTFYGTKARGFGGSNVYVITWGMLDSLKEEPPLPELQREPVLFWPGGGGLLDYDARPRLRDAYHIVGTWSGWSRAEPMKSDGAGNYSYVFTLGENRWEKFQIWLDGDPSRVLHPGVRNAGKGGRVLGPEEGMVCDADELRTGTVPLWLVDGRSTVLSAEEAEAWRGSGYVIMPVEGEEGSEARNRRFRVGTADMGQPGEQYMVHLRLAGKFRLVDWEKLPSDGYNARPRALAASSARSASYSLAASWASWRLLRMAPLKEGGGGGAAGGGHSIEVRLLQRVGEFQIVREEDWNQVIYPSQPQADGSSSIRTLGPDDGGAGLTWLLTGSPGERYLISLQRVPLRAGTASDEGDDEKLTVSWRSLGIDPLTPEERVALSRPRYSVIGSFDEWSESYDLQDRGSEFVFFIQIGSTGEESFQIVQDGDPYRVFWPSVEAANPHEPHGVEGPGRPRVGHEWCIGHNAKDGSAPGSLYEVRLLVAGQGGAPREVAWRKVSRKDVDRIFLIRSAR